MLKAGEGLPRHSAAGEITLYCLEGRLQFSTSSGTHLMASGDLIRLTAGEPHALEAVKDMSRR